MGNDKTLDETLPAPDNVTTLAALRQKAEAIQPPFAHLSLQQLAAMSPQEIQRILHELHVHQIELEMQNDELQQLRNQLDVSRQRYVDLYEQAPVGYCTLNDQGAIVEANQTACTILGTTREALLKKTIPDFIHQADQDIYYLARQEVKTSRKPKWCELRMAQADGTPRWFHLAIKVVGADNSADQFYVVLSDISERRRSLVSLQLERDKLAAAFSDLSIGLVLCNGQGGDISMNPAALRYHGFKSVQEMGKRLEDYARDWELRYLDGRIMPYEDWPLARTIRGECLSNYDVVLHQVNTHFEMVCSYTSNLVRDDAGEVIQIVMTIQDISERIFSQQEIGDLNATLEQRVAERTAQLEEANRAKSDFLATMSHEMRTPLNAIVGLAGLLSTSDQDHRQQDRANKIQLAAQALRLLIDDVLDFSKIEAGELKIEHAEFSLATILDTTAIMMSNGLGDKPVELVIDVAPDVPDALIGDALRLQQVLLNLTGNAVKFTDSGEIVLSLRCLSRESGQVTLCFTVQDTGIGIPSDKIATVFDEFTQADTSISRRYGGAGLGLAICARLAKLNNGRIDVQSELGCGSEFRFTVPFALGVQQQLEVLPEPLKDLRILVIEDHARAREVLARTCACFGWTVTALDSAAAGLMELQRSATESREYDLMLLDWHMPGMDGLAMLRKACATRGIGLPLVVLMAGIFETELAIAASGGLYLDAIGCKPITPNSLLKAVQQAVMGEPAPVLPATESRLSGMRLLVAEDNALNQEVIEEVLIQAGADCVIVTNGEQAIAALGAPGACFDAVLMDLQMPVMDGYTATRIIRDELGLKDLPIIALSANARPEDLERSRREGMAGHLVKPIDIKGLLDLLAQERQTRNDIDTKNLHATPEAATSPLTQIPGLDIEAAMQDFAGNLNKYQQVLDKFISQHGDDAEKAHALVRAGDTKGALHLLHNLIGISSFLRAKDLARLAAATESALLDGNVESLPDLLDPMQRALNLLKASSVQLGAQAQPPCPARAGV